MQFKIQSRKLSALSPLVIFIFALASAGLGCFGDDEKPRPDFMGKPKAKATQAAKAPKSRTSATAKPQSPAAEAAANSQPSDPRDKNDAGPTSADSIDLAETNFDFEDEAYDDEYAEDEMDDEPFYADEDADKEYDELDFGTDDDNEGTLAPPKQYSAQLGGYIPAPLYNPATDTEQGSGERAEVVAAIKRINETPADEPTPNEWARLSIPWETPSQSEIQAVQDKERIYPTPDDFDDMARLGAIPVPPSPVDPSAP